MDSQRKERKTKTKKAANNDDIEKEIIEIYKKYNPSKLGEVNSLLEKCKGKEEALLRKIKEKYVNPSIAGSSSTEIRHPWSFVLKHYSREKESGKKQKENWRIDASIAGIRSPLDELASSIGGECVVDMKFGHRALIVREVTEKTKIDYCGRGSSAAKTHDLESVKFTVERMQLLIRNRQEYIRKKNWKSKANLMTHEHDRRKEEKRVDQEKKKRRDKAKGPVALAGSTDNLHWKKSKKQNQKLSKTSKKEKKTNKGKAQR